MHGFLSNKKKEDSNENLILGPPPSPLNIAILTGKWVENAIWHGLLSHKNSRIPMKKKKLGGPTLCPLGAIF